jgi:hypothetical protein
MKTRRLLVAAFALAFALTLFFGVQALRHAGAVRPAPDSPIAGWMTPRYVSLSWDVPREIVAGALDVELGAGAGRRSLEALARDRGVPVEGLIAELEAAIAAHRAGAE